MLSDDFTYRLHTLYLRHTSATYSDKGVTPVQLDFLIVVVSVVVLALDSLLPGVQWLKGLRVLRALKPLRSVSTPCRNSFTAY